MDKSKLYKKYLKKNCESRGTEKRLKTCRDDWTLRPIHPPGTFIIVMLQSAFMPNTCMQRDFWHKCWSCSQYSFRSSIFSFSFLFFSIVNVSHGKAALIKTYFVKVDGSAKEPRNRPLSKPDRPFLGHLMAILDFAGGAVLQSVRRCRW